MDTEKVDFKYNFRIVKPENQKKEKDGKV